MYMIKRSPLPFGRGLAPLRIEGLGLSTFWGALENVEKTDGKLVARR